MAISVVLYCYKNKLYFDQSLVTLLNQEECDWEAIVVNDGGYVDAEKFIPPQLEDRFNHIRFKKAVGFLPCFLAGLSLTRNDHCVFLRGWDFNSINRLKKQHSLIEASNADSVFSLPAILDFNGKRESVWNYNYTHPIVDPQKIVETVSMLPFSATLGISCVMFDKMRVDLHTLCKYNLSLREAALKPSSSFLEKILVKTLLGSYVYLHKEPLVTVNCKPDIELFEKLDRALLVNYNNVH